MASNVNRLYIYSAVVIIAVLGLLTYTVYKKQRRRYLAGRYVAVQTSRGLIKMQQDAVAEMLAIICAELYKYKGRSYVSKYGFAIDAIIDNLKRFAQQNPDVLKDYADYRKNDIAADIVHNALGETITPDGNQRALAYKTILTDDSLEFGTDEDKFVYLLKHIDVAVKLLHSQVCEDGLLNIHALELLLNALDEDLSNHDSGFYETGLGSEVGSSQDPYEIPKLGLLHQSQSQLEGFSLTTPLKASVTSQERHQQFVLGAQNARDQQERSQLFDKNRKQVMSGTHYVDEDLLLDTTYDHLAL